MVCQSPNSAKCLHLSRANRESTQILCAVKMPKLKKWLGTKKDGKQHHGASSIADQTPTSSTNRSLPGVSVAKATPDVAATAPSQAVPQQPKLPTASAGSTPNPGLLGTSHLWQEAVNGLLETEDWKNYCRYTRQDVMLATGYVPQQFSTCSKFLAI